MLLDDPRRREAPRGGHEARIAAERTSDYGRDGAAYGPLAGDLAIQPTKVSHRPISTRKALVSSLVAVGRAQPTSTPYPRSRGRSA